jgi:peptidoglycan hydrolase-like protein with peptidoglycan-binding domain
MVYSLQWLPTVLRNAGLKVALVEGWETRGRGDIGPVWGVICHHTAGIKDGNMPTLHTLVEGRSDLSGPLAQLGLGRDGTYYVIAAGRANHAGIGSWQGTTTGNSSFIGIEAENTGKSTDFPWPAVQMEAYAQGVAAILKRLGRGPQYCAGHKEYAAGRKPDPSFDMHIFRSSVMAILDGVAPPPALIPTSERLGAGRIGRPTLRRGSSGELVKTVQTKVGVASPDGHFGPKTEAAVRTFQRIHRLVPDGIVGPKTWITLDAN